MTALYDRLFALREAQANATADERQRYEAEIADILNQINSMR
jgi:hypothetical protein